MTQNPFGQGESAAKTQQAFSVTAPVKSAPTKVAPKARPHPRCGQQHYEEAYQLLRSIHNFHGVQPHMVFGISDPADMTPVDWMLKGLPC